MEILQEAEERGNAQHTPCVQSSAKVQRERRKVREFVQQSMKCDKRCEMLVRVEKNASVDDGLLVAERKYT